MCSCSAAFHCEDFLHRHAEDAGQGGQVLDGGKGFPPLPFIDGLGRGKAEHELQVADGEAAPRFEEACEQYALAQLDRAFRTLDYWKSVSAFPYNG